MGAKTSQVFLHIRAEKYIICHIVIPLPVCNVFRFGRIKFSFLFWRRVCMWGVCLDSSETNRATTHNLMVMPMMG